MNVKRAIEHAARILKVGKSRIFLDSAQTKRVKEAITKDDIRTLIREGVMGKRKDAEQSRGRARVLAVKKKKGRKRGHGKRKGKAGARTNTKKRWMGNIRALRRTLRELRTKHPKDLPKSKYRKLYKMIKGNYFKGKKYLEKYVLGGGRK